MQDFVESSYNLFKQLICPDMRENILFEDEYQLSEGKGFT